MEQGIIQGVPEMKKTTPIESSNNPARVRHICNAGWGWPGTAAPLFIIISLLHTGAVACFAAPTSKEIDRLIAAMIQVESGGNDHARGDYRNGKPQAIGCLQIWPITVKDANRISGKHFTLSDRLNKQKSIEICKIVITHYETTLEGMTRRWNGGGNWRKIEKTKDYWAKVQKAL